MRQCTWPLFPGKSRNFRAPNRKFRSNRTELKELKGTEQKQTEAESAGPKPRSTEKAMARTQKSQRTSKGSSSPLAPPSTEAPRKCSGVRSAAGERSISCDAELSEDRKFLCAQCDVEVERRQSAEIARRTNDGRVKLLQLAGLSAPFITGVKSLRSVRQLTLQHREAIAVIERLLRWMPEDGCTLNARIVGSIGVGKSDIAEGFIAEVVARGHGALYVNARTLLVKLQSSFRDTAPESTDAMVERHAKIQFLAVDDLGASKPTRFTADALYELFERRTRNQLPTVVVSNYCTLTDLAERLAPSDGDALDAIRPVDRLDELCPRVIEIRGASLRAVVSRGVAA